MEEKDFLELLSKKILDGATITMDTQLEDIEDWDSLAVVDFMGLADAEFGKTINPVDVQIAADVRGLYELVK